MPEGVPPTRIKTLMGKKEDEEEEKAAEQEEGEESGIGIGSRPCFFEARKKSYFSISNTFPRGMSDLETKPSVGSWGKFLPSFSQMDTSIFTNTNPPCPAPHWKRIGNGAEWDVVGGCGNRDRTAMGPCGDVDASARTKEVL